MLILQNIRKRFGEKEVLRGLDLELAPSGITCLLGSSGCGKSTLLRITAGLEKADSGLVHARPEDCSMVFQDPRLLPWLTVGENLRLALPGTVRSREAAEAIDAALAMVELPAELSRAMPRELSGGMAQRVGVARALLRKPRIMLMDEPFAALDAMTRAHLQDMLRTLMQDAHCLFVTHDISEAFRVAGRICVMQEGNIARTFEASEFVTDEQRRALKRLIVEQLGIRDKNTRED